MFPRIAISLSGDRGLIVIEDGKMKLTLSRNNLLTSDEVAVIACISELNRRLSSGKIVYYDFDAKSFENMAKDIVKCEWLRSGNLKVHGLTDSKRRWCETIDEAIWQPRTFTCNRSMSILLPPHRKMVTNQQNGDSNAAADLPQG